MNETEVLDDIRKLEKQGIFAQPPVSYRCLKGKWVHTTVEVAISKDTEVKALPWNIDIVNKRGAAVTLSSWAVSDCEETGQRVFSFVASMRIPDNMALPPTFDILACSFADFCFFQGHEEVPADHESGIVTKRSRVKQGFVTRYGDLGWIMPCRFADRLIDALGKANDTMLSGVLEDAMLYGVHYTEAQE